MTLLADFLAARWQQQAIPCATLLMGKGVLDEQQPGYVGTYAVAGSECGVSELIEQADMTICVGVRFTDTLTAGFTHNLPVAQLIDIQPFAASVVG
nr:L-glyceraldehyde 3-phosphate reductase [Candidatus Pantoea persica]